MKKESHPVSESTKEWVTFTGFDSMELIGDLRKSSFSEEMVQMLSGNRLIR